MDDRRYACLSTHLATQSTYEWREAAAPSLPPEVTDGCSYLRLPPPPSLPPIPPSFTRPPRPRVLPFIQKLSYMLSHPGLFQDCITWDEVGTCFILAHANPRLLQDVFPRAFGHNSLHSFTRQLNIYGFRRCTATELLSKLDVR
jgi:hypothetical protein